MKKILTVIVVLSLAGFGGCAGKPSKQLEIEPPVYTADRVLKEDIDTANLQVYDPWEPFNRTMYNFNAGFDRYVYLPLVRGYQTVTPSVARKGVTNFFNNLEDIKTLFNQLLQFKVRAAVRSTLRVGWNSTLGLLGVVDVATAFDLKRQKEDFGQTLASYGVGPGPYLVLPLFGPSNLRDGSGLLVDSFAFDQLDPLALEGKPQRQAAYYSLLFVDRRASVAFRYHQTGSPFEYELVRLLYTTKRQIEVEK